jgi:tRNA modification GTPase
LLLQEDRAIVSNIPGTTRDVIEDTIILSGIKFRFIDTAGIRQTTDILEGLGIERTLQKIDTADIIIYLFNIAEINITELHDEISALGNDKKLLLVANHIDIIDAQKLQTIQTELNLTYPDAIYISAKQNQGIDVLISTLLNRSKIDDIIQQAQNSSVVTNIRHLHALQSAQTYLQNIQYSIENQISTDFLVVDIKLALQALGSITGEISNDEVLGEIFSKFCIGK